MALGARLLGRSRQKGQLRRGLRSPATLRSGRQEQDTLKQIGVGYAQLATVQLVLSDNEDCGYAAPRMTNCAATGGAARGDR